MTTTVAFNKGWNSPLTAWNTDTWDGGGAFPSATGEINSVAVTISQLVTGVAATSAIGNTFETSVGFGATGSVGTVTLDGDARVILNGLSGTTALGNVFETNVGVSATSSIGSATVTAPANVSVTGVAGTTALGNVFETNVGLSATASVDSTALGVTGAANVYPSTSGLIASISSVSINLGSSVGVTGLSATTSTGQVLIWGLIVPTQTPNFSTIGGTTAPPLQVPSWIDIAA